VAFRKTEEPHSMAWQNFSCRLAPRSFPLKCYRTALTIAPLRRCSLEKSALQTGDNSHHGAALQRGRSPIVR